MMRQPIVIYEERKTDLVLVIFAWAMKTKETKARPTNRINKPAAKFLIQAQLLVESASR